MAAAKVIGQIENDLIAKPDAEDRVHRFFELPNKLRVVVISDSACDKAACALNVRVGSLLDPRDVQGLAHFCEHMLFLGTEKYPEEDEYNRFLQEHGGGSNAYTSGNGTCYYFWVAPGDLQGALDRFAQFFIAPLFTESCTNREIKAIDSEHRGNIQQDVRRLHQLTHSLSNPKCPFNHFGTGNMKTLRDECTVDVRQKLLEFYEKYYSANIMTLCIIGADSVDTLQSNVLRLFCDVTNNNVHVPEGTELANGEEPFGPAQLCRQIHVVPVRNYRALEFQFMLPSQTHLWRQKSASYLSHLIGHEGPGSVLSALKSRRLATELSAGGGGIDECGVYIFAIAVIVTELGCTHSGIKDVGDLIFAYIDLLKSTNLPSWLPEEVANLAKMRFRFLSKRDAVHYSINLAESLQIHPPEEVVAANYIHYDYDPTQVVQYLELLTLSNMRLVITNKAYESDGTCQSTEPNYGTFYSDRPLDPVWVDSWTNPPSTAREATRLPSANVFVTNDFTLVNPSRQSDKTDTNKEEVSPRHPELLPSSGIYYKPDTSYFLPKGDVRVRITLPTMMNSIENIVYTDLLLRSTLEAINESTYDALMAGLNYAVRLSLDSPHNGSLDAVELEFTGYSQKLPTLIRIVCKALGSPQIITEDHFRTAKQILERGLQITSETLPPYRQLAQRRGELFVVPYFSHADRLAQTKQATYHELMQFSGIDNVQMPSKETIEEVISDRVVHPASKGLWAVADVEVLVLGNFSAEHARGMAKDVVACLGVDSAPDHLPPTGCCTLKGPLPIAGLEELADAKRRLRCVVNGTNPDDSNNAAGLHVVSGGDDYRKAALLMLCNSWLHQKFFDDLRTKQQIGYVVMGTVVRVLHTAQLVFLVQTAQSTRKAATEMQHFLMTHLGTDLNDPIQLDQAEFDLHRTATISRLKQTPKKLAEEAARYFGEIAVRRYEFDRRERQVALLETATLEHFKTFVKDVVIGSPWLLIEISSQCAVKTDETLKPETYTWNEISSLDSWIANKSSTDCDVCPYRRTTEGK